MSEEKDNKDEKLSGEHNVEPQKDGIQEAETQRVEKTGGADSLEAGQELSDSERNQTEPESATKAAEGDPEREAKLKAAAEARAARAAAKAAEGDVAGGDPEREAKLKAAAEARAARAAAKAAEGDAAGGDPEREAKLKAAAEARAARAAAKASEGDAAGGDSDREAKLKAAAEARAARAAAKAADAEPAEPKPPSPKQPQLDETVQLLRSLISEHAVEEAYINEINDHMPVIVVSRDHWQAAADLLRTHAGQQYSYLRNVSGVDYETHMEVVYHLVSLETRRELAVKLRTDREAPSIPSATPIWATANWNEREIYDLLGVDFTGHPDMRRIMMPDEWVGHPLRKDYEPLDPEV
ncbi:NADH-quinone oxidoreductase subunit C [Paenibacillus spongiae]|uniref:NADH-quinone oxidoreductase subunit C n=1 Tax=Paenibacillus spongiae TaxID=2909671 RepID=A0ABY5SB66_9BACL|nr:NADH-quinone oxidoreductase subunit C [Paenibacillus spongiae]UVI29943.1 NADH-quinone oxidoreductase subunit C [Paenibacillus spongiae]